MFGYVKVNSAELKVKEYELYRGAYCGLCRSMGKCTGQCSRMSLSYDFAFLVAVRLCLTDTKMSFSQKRCFVHPLKKRNVMDRNEQLDLCAHAAAILGYHKIKDDLSDEKGLKKLKARLAYPFVASWRRRALKAGFDDLDKSVADSLGRLAELEGKELASVDAPAELFGELLARITSYGLEGARARIAAELGRCVGKWIYIVDALDDCAEDKEKNRYNPFLLLYGGRLPEGAELASISDALKLELCGAEAAMDLLETDKIPVKNIIENILYLGMPQTVDKIVCEENESKNGKKPKKKGKSENERSL
ncbi:MAG: hypothetical protein IJZ83_10475 [Clostridia bacterium]|nr:hypothetical protein [Clostridia bacterium]MBR4013991.1 hypothetical protein [Clostridia bacterium]